MEKPNKVGREILDSRGNPSVEANAKLGNHNRCEETPSCHARVGEHEEVQLRGSHDPVRQTSAESPDWKGKHCERTTCALKSRFVEWFELICLVMLLLTGLLEHVVWLIRWVEEMMHR